MLQWTGVCQDMVFKKPWDYLWLICYQILIAFLNLSSISFFLIGISFHFVQTLLLHTWISRTVPLLFFPSSYFVVLYTAIQSTFLKSATLIPCAKLQWIFPVYRRWGLTYMVLLSFNFISYFPSSRFCQLPDFHQAGWWHRGGRGKDREKRESHTLKKDAIGLQPRFEVPRTKPVRHIWGKN